MVGIPMTPGRASAEEILSYIGPAVDAITDVYAVSSTGSTPIISPKSRKAIIIQPSVNIWLSIGSSEAVPQQCLFIPAYAIFGVDGYPSLKVSMRGETASGNVVITQLIQEVKRGV